MPTKARTLVLCFDGTANQFDGEVRFVASTRPVCLLTPIAVEHEYRQVLRPPQEGRNRRAALLLPSASSPPVLPPSVLTTVFSRE